MTEAAQPDPDVEAPDVEPPSADDSAVMECGHSEWEGEAARRTVEEGCTTCARRMFSDGLPPEEECGACWLLEHQGVPEGWHVDEAVPGEPYDPAVLCPRCLE